MFSARVTAALAKEPVEDEVLSFIKAEQDVEHERRREELPYQMRLLMGLLPLRTDEDTVDIVETLTPTKQASVAMVSSDIPPISSSSDQACLVLGDAIFRALRTQDPQAASSTLLQEFIGPLVCWEVVHGPWVPIRERPTTQSAKVALKQRGEIVWSDGEPYGDWIKVLYFKAGSAQQRLLAGWMLMTCAATGLLIGRRFVHPHGLKPNEVELCDAIRHGDLQEVLLLLKAGAPLDTPDEVGETPLFEAVASSNRDMVAALLVYGADPSTRSMCGMRAGDMSIDAETRSLLGLFASQAEKEERTIADLANDLLVGRSDRETPHSKLASLGLSIQMHEMVQKKLAGGSPPRWQNVLATASTAGTHVALRAQCWRKMNPPNN
eukprot:gnl/TRDRNA2_/TRDRNA2_202431_c0_seq1.p1 gnl/TRDRNA2_/TRDRNA2_202431_c0~~gnl/TRDRNA2_/TRDRNA2_202431_c0_seq1.p1  ORF type:complete len:394 (-),score=58.53 gnl/TRDRNA2_/TRDRNA2_202431_c0_seq1:17-1156(-)